MQNAARVGGLVVVFGGLIAGGYTILGKSLFPSANAIYYAELPDAGGITAGTKALMAGVEVGTVKEVVLKDASTARMTLELKKGLVIPQGSELVIPGSLISFGLTPVEIVSKPGATGTLPEGSVLPGRKASPLDAFLPDAKGALGDVQGTLVEVQKTLKGAQKWLDDDELRGGLTSLMKSSEEAVSKISSSVDALIAQNRPVLNDIIRTVAATTKEISRGSKLVVDLIEKGDFQKESMDLLKKFNESADKANAILAEVQEIAADPSLRQSIGASLENVKTITESGVRIAESGEKIAANTATVSERAIQLADQASELMVEVKGAVGSVNEFLNKAKSAGGSIPRIQTTMDLSRDLEEGRFQTDFMFELPFQSNLVRLGVFDAFEGDRLVAQLGKEFGKDSKYFYGVYGGKPGVGVSSQIAPKVSLTADLFDLNKPRLDLRLRYDFGGGVNAWAGVNRMFGRSSPTIGIGIRR